MARQSLMKQHYCNTLLDMCEEVPLSRVSVVALIERAGTARQTFYNNFRDINDLIAYLPISFLESHAQGAHSSFAVRSAYEFATKHKGFFECLPQHSGQNNFRSTFLDWMRGHYYAMFITEDLSPDEVVYRKIAIDEHCFGIVDVFLEWCSAQLSWPIDALLKAHVEAAPAFIKEAGLTE